MSRMSENVGAPTSCNPKALHSLYRDNFIFALHFLIYWYLWYILHTDLKTAVFSGFFPAILSKHVRNSMNSAQVIHVLLLCLYVHNRGLKCLKHLGFLDSPSTSNGIFLDLCIFAHIGTATDSLICIKCILFMAFSQK
jgi:hypothetical protein